MTFWRIRDGIPSFADALLVAGGPVFGIGCFVAIADPFLDYFEPKGLLYLGFGLLFVIGLIVGGGGFAIFWRNQQKIRPEIRIPRLVFAFASVPLIFIFHQLLLPVFWKPLVNDLDQAWRNLGFSLIVIFAWLYVAVVKAALRYPERTTIIALWFNIGLCAIGLVAKVSLLFTKK